MNEPLVSVCMNTYNRAQFLRATLDSVFAQDYPNLEVVVVDDASTDETLEILRSYGDRLRLTVRAQNSGTADIPRYEAVQQSRGVWCAFLDSDDLWLPNKISRQVAFMQAHPGVPLCHTYVRLIDENGREGGVRHEGAVPATGHIGPALLRHCFICTSSVMVKREAWLEAQTLQDITGFGTEWDFFLSVAREHEIGFLPEVLVLYRRSSAGISQKNWKRKPRDVVALSRIYGKGLWKGLASRAEYADIMAHSCLENAVFWRGEGEPGKALWFCGQGLKFNPLRPALLVEGCKGLVRMLTQPGAKS